MVVSHFYNNLFRPYFLVYQLITVVNGYDKVNGALKDQRFVLSNIKTEEKWVFCSGIYTKRQGSFLLSGDLLRINENFLNTEPITLTWVNQRYLKILYFQESVVFNNYFGTLFKHTRGRLHIIC
jgi:hypothetical protein